ncbi:hypothetical protein JZ751_020365 [Albula glossodonta]|uniref:Uncharacterized protein n=1 Tax=Albula glossodonta TaxID=121402 RepID=A0A8T2NJA0_9TELE|nr:hypothetical protein JZ751_020365 [Albula glossodonta]
MALFSVSMTALCQKVMEVSNSTAGGEMLCLGVEGGFKNLLPFLTAPLLPLTWCLRDKQLSSHQDELAIAVQTLS